MKYLYFLLTLVCIEILLQIGYSIKYPKDDPFEGKGRESVATDRIICVGDSIVWGAGASSRKKSFPSQLSVLMGHEAVRNLGELSATSEDTLHLVRKIIPYVSGTIIVHTGYNDDRVASNHGLRKSMIVRLLMKPFPRRKQNMEDWKHTMESILVACDNKNIPIRFLKISTANKNKRIEEMNAWVARHYWDIPITLKPEHFINEIHLNDEGYAEMARQILEGIK